jgi:hypothetical protein
VIRHAVAVGVASVAGTVMALLAVGFAFGMALRSSVFDRRP